MSQSYNGDKTSKKIDQYGDFDINFTSFEAPENEKIKGSISDSNGTSGNSDNNVTSNIKTGQPKSINYSTFSENLKENYIEKPTKGKDKNDKSKKDKDKEENDDIIDKDEQDRPL